MRRRLVLAGVLLAAVAAGTVSVERAACWTQTDGWVCGPLAPAGGAHASLPVTGLTRVEVIAPAWRPLRVRLRAAGLAGGGTISVADAATFAAATAIPPDREVTVMTSARDVSPNRLVLWADGPAPARLEVVSVEPTWSLRHGVRAFAMGAAALLVLVWGLAGGSAPVPAEAHQRKLTSADAAVALGLLALYLAWAVLKPPLQSPDEVQHHARATSIPATPFVGGAWEVSIYAAHRNPLTWTPNALHRIITRPDDRLSAKDVADVRPTPWRPPSAYPPVEHLATAIAAYPPTYYWVEFLGGEALTGLFGLSPYASIIAYRVVSSTIGWLLWLAVLALLRESAETRDWAHPAWLILAATPAVASISGAVSYDALVIPATLLAILAGWRVLATGTGIRRLAWSIALVLALKPSGIVAITTIVAGAVAWGYARPADRGRAFLVLRRLIAVGAGGWLAYYSWSPPWLSPVPGSPSLSAPAYVVSLVHRVPNLWLDFWGRLGWLEYSAPMWWYWLLLVTVVALAALAIGRRRVDVDLARYAMVTSAVYAAMVVGGEFTQHAQAGLMLQGRYFAPAALPLALLAGGQDRVSRWTLPALLAGLHVALAGATVDRYFGGDWALWWRALSGGS